MAGAFGSGAVHAMDGPHLFPAASKRLPGDASKGQGAGGLHVRSICLRGKARFNSPFPVAARGYLFSKGRIG
jgi:hypothetical protein